MVLKVRHVDRWCGLVDVIGCVVLLPFLIATVVELLYGILSLLSVSFSLSLDLLYVLDKRVYS